MGSLFRDLLDDLMIQTIALLSIESILRFKTITGSWNEPLSAPSFATTHFLSSPLSQPFPLFFCPNKQGLIYYIMQNSLQKMLALIVCCVSCPHFLI
ncbi:hypothetical protein AMTRI_Chr09g15950 [Amborella trichopoda]